MKTDRRGFLKTSALGAGVIGLMPAFAAEKPAPTRAANFLTGQPKMRLGTVTYNLAQDWDIEAIIKNCEAAKFAGVELRTTHAHKVEVNLNKEQRDQVRKRFADSAVELMGLGSAFDYHTPDQAKLKKDIADTREYMILAHDVGATGVKVRPNGLPKEVSKEKTLEQIGKALRELGAFGDSHGVAIRLEVHGAGTALLPNIKTIMDVADHKNVGVCWNSNPTDLDGDGFDPNFNLVKEKIFSVHLRDLYLDDYPFRKLFTRLKEINFTGFCLAEIPPSNDPVRVMKYFRALWLAYQGLL
jgi:sugar phosphate isomerase/epimerase